MRGGRRVPQLELGWVAEVAAEVLLDERWAPGERRCCDEGGRSWACGECAAALPLTGRPHWGQTWKRRAWGPLGSPQGLWGVTEVSGAMVASRLDWRSRCLPLQSRQDEIQRLEYFEEPGRPVI